MELRSSEVHGELSALRRKLELLEEEREESSRQAEGHINDLHLTVEELHKKLQAATPTTPAPPPPAPPPPAAAVNPLRSLLSLIRKRRDVSPGIPLPDQGSAKTPDDGVRQQAVEEMMQRIKKGVQLRPVQARREEKISRNPPQATPQATPSVGDDAELQRILLRRRDALESRSGISDLGL